LILLAGALLERPALGGGAGEVVRPPSAEHWARILQHYCIEGGVDYRGLRQARDDLDIFLSLIATAEPASADRHDAMAFWINAYNAIVIGFVLEQYPEIRSVKDVEGFFNRQTAVVAGEEMTLDQIEARALEYGDPRVHFALVCASLGCPDLRDEPYDGEYLDSQLDEQTRMFLLDEGKGLRLAAEAGTLWVSSIFKWYGGDFTGGSTAIAYLRRGRLLEWMADFLPAALVSAIHSAHPSIRYIEYDWRLNDRESE
jgi:hypothetical protein